MSFVRHSQQSMQGPIGNGWMNPQKDSPLRQLYTCIKLAAQELEGGRRHPGGVVGNWSGGCEIVLHLSLHSKLNSETGLLWRML